MNNKGFYIVILSAIVSVALVGCGGNEVLLRPDYSSKEIKSHRVTNSNLKVTKVIDRRKMDSTTVGTARVGMMNRVVPYHVAVPLSNFVQGVLDSLLLTSSSSPITPAIVYIDSFMVGERYSLFSETGVLETEMYFGVPISRDSLVYITTRATETVSSGVDVTDFLEPLMYKGIVDCGLQFVESVHNMNSQLLAVRPDSISSVPIPAEKENISSLAIGGVGQVPRPKEFRDVGFGSSSGGKIQSEIRLYGDMLSQKDSSRSLVGFGLNLDILNISNKSAMIDGSVVSFGGDFVLRQMLSDRKVSPYVGLQGTLTFGSETIDYGDRKETSFFFGPFVRETLGLSFNKKVFLEAGVFEIVLMGSKMLPSDIGFTANVSFGI